MSDIASPEIGQTARPALNWRLGLSRRANGAFPSRGDPEP